MSRTDYRTLIHLGRKAGLNTAELYRALTLRPPDAAEHANGHADENGYVSGISQSGRPVYRPVTDGPK
jgi:hypothetical protein